MVLIDRFFATARERYRMKLRRFAGEDVPWTTDPILSAWRFCNVHREDDKTTVWFRENVRSHLTRETAVFSTVAFRWFNRIETGQLIRDFLVSGTWDTHVVRKRLKDVRPLTTGAYIINSPWGMNKLDGILQCLGKARRLIPKLEIGSSLRESWRELQALQCFGSFMAYEVVSDLRWTPVLADAEDRMTWAAAGPGCARGLGRVLRDDPNHFHYGSASGQAEMLDLMQTLLAYSRDTLYWPAAWRHWEMREVEHWACEFDKYERALRGDRLKRRYP